MKNNAALGYAVLLIVGDFLALLAAFGLAYILRVKIDDRPLLQQISAGDYFRAMFSVLPLWILVHAFIGLYTQRIYDRRFPELGRLLVGSILGILVLVGYDFISNSELFPARLVPVYGLALGFGFLVVFRTLVRLARRMLFGYGIGVNNVLIVGGTAKSAEVAEAIANTKSTGQHVLGIVDGRVKGFKHFPTFKSAQEYVNMPIHSIIQTELYNSQEKNDEILRFAQVNHAAYRFVPGNSSLFVGNMEVELFGGSIPMIAVHQTSLTGWGRIVKRLFDIASALILIIVTSPIMLITAIAVKLNNPRGPILMHGVQQNRLTRYNRIFKVFKFRSHYAKFDGKTDEEVFAMVGKPELIEEYRKNGDKLDYDFRVTPVGRVIRRTHIDELPQLFNILKGDISLVGPRALIPNELNKYEKKHTILSVKSGLTGLAQVSGMREISFEERRQLDTFYVQNWSFWMDLTILVKTIKAVIRG